MNKVFAVRDINGNMVAVYETDMLEAMGEIGELYGMPFNAIVNLRSAYMAAGGKIPITEESTSKMKITFVSIA